MVRSHQSSLLDLRHLWFRPYRVTLHNRIGISSLSFYFIFFYIQIFLFSLIFSKIKKKTIKIPNFQNGAQSLIFFLKKLTLFDIFNKFLAIIVKISLYLLLPDRYIYRCSNDISIFVYVWKGAQLPANTFYKRLNEVVNFCKWFWFCWIHILGQIWIFTVKTKQFVMYYLVNSFSAKASAEHVWNQGWSICTYFADGPTLFICISVFPRKIRHILIFDL
jgi:hypothetical protein